MATVNFTICYVLLKLLNVMSILIETYLKWTLHLATVKQSFEITGEKQVTLQLYLIPPLIIGDAWCVQ